MKMVFVVMGNDFPEAVFTDCIQAQAFADRKRDEDSPITTRLQPACAHRIYWRVTPFELDQHATEETD